MAIKKSEEKHFYLYAEETNLKELGDVFDYNELTEKEFLNKITQCGEEDFVFFRFKFSDLERISIKSTLEIIKA